LIMNGLTNMDPKIQEFRDKQINKGFEPSIVDAYIEKKQSESKMEYPQGEPNMDFSFSPESMPSGSQMSILPGRFPMTQAFGNYNPSVEMYSGGRNWGADFAAPRGTTMAVPQGDWVVEESFGGAKEGNRGINSGYGNTILLKNRRTGERLRYEHLTNVYVKPGQMVTGGNVVATVGSTGNSTGSHASISYIDPAGKIRDILKSPYRNQLFGG